ncbi:MAG TPA: hypothetical protein ENI76_03890 [Ignavibacteria bacterium]|nr:hypothetical protein [Ignavibacteria bacterium]
MKVKELIKELAKSDMDTEIVFACATYEDSQLESPTCEQEDDEVVDQTATYCRVGDIGQTEEYPDRLTIFLIHDLLV